jgi:hypothetical protein
MNNNARTLSNDNSYPMKIDSPKEEHMSPSMSDEIQTLNTIKIKHECKTSTSSYDRASSWLKDEVNIKHTR